MNIKYSNYAITHDGDNYVVNKVSIISAEKGKPENVGKETYKKLKYYSTLKSALKSMRDMLIVDKLDGVDDLNKAIETLQLEDVCFINYLNDIN